MLKNKNCLVTGCAGFIGSHLTEKLLALDCPVIGLDSFTDYYRREIKESNLAAIKNNPKFTLVEKDLSTANLSRILEDVDYIFHQAAQAGVRASWGGQFSHYLQSNVAATQNLLEAAKAFPIKKIVYASSSSIYGDSPLPMKEGNVLCPVSPYGVTKLAAENLCYLYWKNFKVPVVSLRYFTVFGPRQRPDMGIYKFINAALQGEKIRVYGDGKQTRDFTFISDIVQANLAAAEIGQPGLAMNIGGGSQITINEVLSLIESMTGKKLQLEYLTKAKGDVQDTLADINLAKESINYNPTCSFKEGLKQQIDYLKLLLK
ncbi:MAG: NAD-dependent epimerase/dehydratase family protein [bacterium]|nr:NAD-dependent epimerase/dehydratase family protein [bacterium]MDD5757366.1 NAD-dependent epimerase/dehydratase family protein [bacterium]